MGALTSGIKPRAADHVAQRGSKRIVSALFYFGK
jgi:hypothetical protein